MKRSLIAMTQLRILCPAALLIVTTSIVTSCNSKSPSIKIAPSEGAQEEYVGDYQEGDSIPVSAPAPNPSAGPSSPAPQPLPAPVPVMGEESVTPPTVVTGSPAVENQNSNGQQIIPNARYFIKSAGSKKCLSLPNDSKNNGVQLIQRTCDANNTAQKFDVAIVENGYFRITNFSTGKSLEIRDQKPLPQAAIQQNDYFAKSHQQFIIALRSDGFYHLITLEGKMFVDLAGASVNDGALIQVWGTGGGINEAWIFEQTY